MGHVPDNKLIGLDWIGSYEAGLRCPDLSSLDQKENPSERKQKLARILTRSVAYQETGWRMRK